MINIFFTADYHLGHKNIIKYCNRPFNNIDEMDKTILDNLFSKLKRGDILYFLGDFAFGHKYYEEFPGLIEKYGINLIFIQGNHDKKLKINACDLKTIKIEKQIIVLCHYPLRVWDRSHYGSWQLHGHSHGTLPPLGMQYDVGVDNNNFVPVSYEEIKNIMKEKCEEERSKT